ncbi:phosphate ABC transporter permease PstA [Candidatus Poribacteria bacterium]|nr:phosphate ABC transporter permease PstA [Candidatus Poribacteria bacterium]
MLKPRWVQVIVKILLIASTLFSIFILTFIIYFVLKNGLPQISLDFLLSSPQNMGKAGGIYPTILGTLFITFIAIMLSTPLGVGTAIFLTEYTSEGSLTKVVRFGAECLAGIPSIIFGLFGFVLFVEYLKFGWSILSGGLTLTFMILPTIIRTTEEAIKAVPYSYREVSYSLGATRWQTIKNVVLPGALPGIVTGAVLGIGRSIGETAAVIFTAGGSLNIPQSLLDSSRTMSVHFYILAREGISMPNAYGTAAILLLSILLINIFAYWLMHKITARFS